MCSSTSRCWTTMSRTRAARARLRRHRKYSFDSPQSAVLRPLDRLESPTSAHRHPADKRAFLLNLTCFARCIEGLFLRRLRLCVFFASLRFAASAWRREPAWVFRDESAHMAFALRGDQNRSRGRARSSSMNTWAREKFWVMIEEAVECEIRLCGRCPGGGGVVGLHSPGDA